MKLINAAFCIVILSLFVSCRSQKQPNLTKLNYQSGDLIFQDLDCGELCDAIEKVTTGYKGKSFSHIGLVYDRVDSVFVIEAVGAGVRLTPLESFLNRNRDENGVPKVIIGRLKKEYRKLNDSAISFAVQKRGTAYDHEFIYNNGKYYCSELIYDAYKYANNNQPFFQLEPMTFKDTVSHQTLPVWETYYSKMGIDIPEGQPGCNPAGLSRSDKLEIIWQ
ncbi:MAG TPA: YiiX/YebB-like N1pC/P60 family cysteine hydrolase [Bacteroidia bacterium]|nr:YiiX/YebB-like N1pC/P60 family cysteine hydrolase [Bacteroidia bacterium]